MEPIRKYDFSKISQVREGELANWRIGLQFTKKIIPWCANEYLMKKILYYSRTHPNVRPNYKCSAKYKVSNTENPIHLKAPSQCIWRMFRAIDRPKHSAILGENVGIPYSESMIPIIDFKHTLLRLLTAYRYNSILK